MVQSASDSDDLALTVAVLGTFQVRKNRVWEQAPTRQVARVGTVLAGWPGEAVERDRIMAAVWGDKPPTTATNTLQVHVSHLRRLVGKDAVRSNGTTYLLDLPPEAIDAEQFVEAVHEAARMRRKLHFRRAAEILTDGLAHWRGTPYPDITDPDLLARRAKLEELKAQAREDLLECRLELAADQIALADVVAETTELVSRHPERERGHALLVRALAAAGRPGESSAAFEAAQERLRAALGLDPGRELVDVHARALRDDDDIRPRAMRAISIVPPARTTDAHRATAERARSAIVDLGATLVTVINDDPGQDAALTAALSDALAGDLPTGVIALTEGEATVTALDAALASHDPAPKAAPRGTLANSGSHDLKTLIGREALAVIVATGDGTLAQPLCDTFNEWVEAPRLVVISRQRLDSETEVVIAHEAKSARTPARGHGA